MPEAKRRRRQWKRTMRLSFNPPISELLRLMSSELHVSESKCRDRDRSCGEGGKRRGGESRVSLCFCVVAIGLCVGGSKGEGEEGGLKGGEREERREGS